MKYNDTDLLNKLEDLYKKGEIFCLMINNNFEEDNEKTIEMFTIKTQHTNGESVREILSKI
jgi:hypothetical protein